MPINRETLRGIKKLDNEKFLAWLTAHGSLEEAKVLIAENLLEELLK